MHYLNQFPEAMKYSVLQGIILFTATIFISACSKTLDPDAYIVWVKDTENGLRKVKKANGFVFNVQYKPFELIWLEKGGDKSKGVNTQNEGLQYLELSIKPETGTASILNIHAGSQQELQQNLYYYSYLFEHDIFLEIDGEKFPCSLFHFERGVDVKPERTFSLGFDAPTPKNGLVTLLIKAERLSALPIRIQLEVSKIPTLKV